MEGVLLKLCQTRLALELSALVTIYDMVLLIVSLMALLAFANGANDNCKGVVTLVGYGVARPRHALVWAMVTTAIGAAISFWASSGLVKSFSSGLFAEGAPLDTGFFAAVLCGASGCVILATLTGFPVSTTHAITGALTGAGLVAFGNAQMQWNVLGAKFALPLALSPLLSLSVVFLLSWPILFVVGRLAGRCACLTEEPVVQSAGGAATMAATRWNVVVDNEEACREQPKVASATTSATLNAYHWMTSGFIGFARGWNDSPKIASLGLVTLSSSHGMALSFAVVTLAMAVGGLVSGRKVLETLAKKITPLPLAESLTASTTTATLVSLASWHGLPVSTTHVSTGAIVGAGLKHNTRAVHWGKVGEIVLAWIVTLPLAALIAATMQWAIR